MIIRRKSESYDGSHRVVAYEPGADGKLTESSRKSDLDDQIATFYDQRKLEMERLRREVLQGAISPIALFMTYQQMTLGDLAKRVKLSQRAVKKHLTAKGFRGVTVELLQRYARVFDLAVADFFQFLDVPEGIEAREERRLERLFQIVTLEVEAGEGDDAAG